MASAAPDTSVSRTAKAFLPTVINEKWPGPSLPKRCGHRIRYCRRRSSAPTGDSALLKSAQGRVFYDPWPVYELSPDRSEKRVVDPISALQVQDAVIEQEIWVDKMCFSETQRVCTGTSDTAAAHGHICHVALNIGCSFISEVSLQSKRKGHHTHCHPHGHYLHARRPADRR